MKEIIMTYVSAQLSELNQIIASIKPPPDDNQ